MSRFFRRILDIREGEGFKTLYMFSYIFFIIASLMIVKPIRNSYFLTEIGIEMLPLMFVLVAVSSGAVVYLYAKISKKIRLNYLISFTTLILILSLLLFWSIFKFGFSGKWLPYVFYIWVSLYGVISTTQFWLLANYVFNTREAKRLYGIIGAGAIAGGICGGYLTNFLAPLLKSANLLFICVFFLCCTIFILIIVWRKSARYGYKERISAQKRAVQSEASENPFHLILKSSHLKLLASLVGIGVLVAHLVDYQYSAVASEIIKDPNELTAFFGFWLSNLSVASLIIQILLTGRVLKSLGVIKSLFFLPLGILVGAAAILANPALWSAILVKVSEGSFKQSINKAGLELLIMPVPALIKNQAKSVIDVFVDNLAAGIGGILLIILISVAGLGVKEISIAIIILLIVWGYLIVKMRDEYVNSFRKAIDKRTIDIDDQSVNLNDASLLDSILENLKGDNDRQILHILDLIEDATDNRIAPYLQDLIDYPLPEIRARALKMLSRYEKVDVREETEKLTGDKSQEVKIAAIRYLCARSGEISSTLGIFLNSDDPHIRAAAVMCAAREIEENPDMALRFDMTSILHKFLESVVKDTGFVNLRKSLKISIAEFIGNVESTEFNHLLKELLEDESIDVLKASIKSAGTLRAREFVKHLISHLKTREVTVYAREALAEYGDDILEILIDHFLNPAVIMKIRQRIPKVIALIGSKKALESLYKLLSIKEQRLRFQVIKALNTIRVNYPLIKFNQKPLERAMLAEIEIYYRLNMVLYMLNQKAYRTSTMTAPGGGLYHGSRARRLLIQATQEKMDQAREIVFRFLGLGYDARDIYNAYLGITSNQQSLRANSVEFIDNILSQEYKKYILPMLDSYSAKSLVEPAERLFQLEIPTERYAINFLLGRQDYWLKTCALYFISELRKETYVDAVDDLRNNVDPVVAETAEYAFKKIAGRGRGN
jgi:AAA family ATP:ADP antiporter